MRPERLPIKEDSYLISFLFCALMPFVFDAATAPAEALRPDPDQAVPPRVGKLLGLVHTLIAYGRNLAATLRQHAADPQLLPCVTFVAITFASSDLVLILARITRGLLRAAALEERLRQRAARGQDLEQSARIRPPSPRKPRAAKPAPGPHDPARDPCLDSPPTLEQIAAEDRRRPIGAVLVDICLDLSIVPDQMDRATWNELRRHIIEYGGNLGTLVLSRLRSFDPAASHTDIPLPLPIDIADQPIVVFPAWPAPPPQSKALASTGPP